MRIDDASYQDLIGAIYDAALESARWPDVLVRVSDALSAVGALYLSYDLRRPDEAFHVLGRLDPELTRSYLLRYSRTSPWATVRTMLPIGEAVAIDAFVPAAVLRRSEFYNDILRPQRVLHCGSVCLRQDAGRYAGFSVFRSAEAGPTEQCELRFLTALAPHVKRAGEISERLADAAALKRAGMIALDCLDHGLMLVNAEGRVLFANRLAEVMIALDDGLTVVAQVVRAATPADTQRFHALVAGAAKGAAGGTIRLARPSLAEPLLVLVAPASSRHPWPSEVKPAALVFITDPERMPRFELRQLMSLFDLTPTEAKVALAVSSGQGVPETAQALCMSTNTIHTHMRRIFRKLGVNRQAELARLLARLPAVTLRPSEDERHSPAR
jgi:DNA-binding CsgD family transcriptional regulator